MAVDLSQLPEAEEAPQPAVTAELYMLSRLLDGAEWEEAFAEAREKYPRNEVYRAKLKIERMFFEE